MIKRILQEVKEYRKASFLAPIFMVGEVVLEISLPFLMSFIIDKGVSQGDMTEVTKYGVIMIVAAFGSLFCGAMSGKYAAYASAGFAKNLRRAMFYNIQDFSFHNIDKFSTAGLVTRLMTDVTNIQNAYQMVLRMCVRAPLTLVCAMAMTFVINAELSMVFLYAIAFLGIVLIFIMKFAHPIFLQVFNRYDDLNASVQENITNMRVVKAYVKEDYEISKFNKASYNIYRMFKKAENILIFNSPAMQLSMYACILAISWLGARMIVDGSMTTGELMSMMTYTTNILMSLMMLSMIFVMLSMSFASVQRIDEVLDEKSDIVSPEKAVTELKDGSIDFHHVSFAYSVDQEADSLEDIDLHIRSGETIGILGGTGSGKSSLVQLIPRLYDVTKGSLNVGGVDVKEFDLDVLRNQVSMVLQNNVLFSGTIKDNLRWGNPNASDEEMLQACRLAQADEFIQRFPDGYDTHIEQGGSNVSGGQKQRLCIARALLKKPKILILDDSTSAVDTRTDYLIRKAFREDIPDITKLIISQRISSIEDADRIVVLDDGKINGIGTHAELLKTNEIYQEVYRTQVKGGDENAD
ncbi:ABC transporter ATP-binding protein/permease [[Clostridium] innocuum]|jgi:ATP-binding cassette, subfamily B, multidrug efflux pump|uniref:ABC transporter ATP-binding protein n=1 Tax=Clostridium innocuum TaxID=1522 RepID=UPI001F5859B9|nr:ABC transporter ATP-binding protein [[Clostridium] innocuum]MCI2982337.1 ABC transporter ATP-binding protein/permease [[Clostridium] innocuum]MCR0493077.1 ABC transporter ATP-binding protein/permease [[Clostridium] innocuum]MCR0510710.1 ABC transporter ATP-binding protein/permease [[Clostridium] innocuum]MCR0531707.1 ABC transporter ATP-binding protein/permease [[Clostridium] innocuum]